MRSPMGLGDRRGRPPSPGTPSVEARLFLRPGEGAGFVVATVGAGARAEGAALWVGGEGG